MLTFQKTHPVDPFHHKIHNFPCEIWEVTVIFENRTEVVFDGRHGNYLLSVWGY